MKLELVRFVPLGKISCSAIQSTGAAKTADGYPQQEDEMKTEQAQEAQGCHKHRHLRQHGKHTNRL